MNNFDSSVYDNLVGCILTSCYRKIDRRIIPGNSCHTSPERKL